MKLITAVIRPSSLEAVKAALTAFGVRGLTVGQILWANPDVNRVEVFRGRERQSPFDPRLRLELLAPAEEAEDLAQVIARVVGNEERHSPPLFIGPVHAVVRVRSGERDLDAI